MGRGGTVRVPSLPLWRLALAIASVPGVYVVLLASAALALGVAAVAIAVLYEGIRGEVSVFPFPALILIIILIAVGGLYAFYATLVGIYRSFRRYRHWEPALIVRKANQIELFRFIDEVCAALNCRVPEAVLLSTEPTFSVCQGKVQTFNGKANGRLLLIGCPFLGSLTVSELRAALSHELAHFTGRDTMFSAFVLPAYAGVAGALGQMETVFSAAQDDRHAGYMSLAMIVPAFLLRHYINVFHRFNASLRRLRETRADLIASHYAGSESFASGLKKEVREGTLFAHNCRDHIMQGLRDGKAFANYYQAFRDMTTTATKVLDEIEQAAMADQGGPDDFHPPLRVRLKQIPPRPDPQPDDRPARVLLNRPDEIEKQLTAYLTSYYEHMAAAMARAQANEAQ